MGEVNLKLTPEQIEKVSEVMELKSDTIMVTLEKETISNSNSFIAMGKTFTVS